MLMPDIVIMAINFRFPEDKFLSDENVSCVIKISMWKGTEWKYCVDTVFEHKIKVTKNSFFSNFLENICFWDDYQVGTWMEKRFVR